MRRYFCLVITALVVLSFLVGCAPAAPTVAPTKPSLQATTAAPLAPTIAPAVSTVPPAAATKPAAAAATAAPVAKVKRGGTARLGRGWTYNTMDPHVATGTGPAFGMLYDALLRYDIVDEKAGRFETKPALAESWQVADPKTIVLKLRKGVKFHDGSDLTAEVVKWNLDRMRTHPKSAVKEFVQSVDSVEVVDPQTIKLNLKTPSASLLVNISHGGSEAIGMISKAAVDKLGEEVYGAQPSGTGPMQFGDWVRDDRVTLKKFDGYWQTGADGKPLPYLDGVIYRFIQDTAVMILEMRAGNLEAVDDIEGKDIATIKSDPNLVYWEHPSAAFINFTAGFNPKTGPFAENKKLRQAAIYATDREGMAKALGFGVGKPAYYPRWYQGMVGYDESLPKYPFDITKAKQLMQEAGFPNGIDITMTEPSRSAEIRVAEVAQQMWAQAGIRVGIDAVERLAAIDKVKNYNFNVYQVRGTVVADPDLNSTYLLSGAAQNWTSYSNKDFDKCMEEGRSNYDTAKRQEIYRRCQQFIYEDAFLLTGFALPRNWVLSKSLKAFKVQWSNADLREAWLDK